MKSMDMERILVTGANGYIGRYVVDMLLHFGYTVRAMLEPGSNVSPLQRRTCEKVYADLLDRRSLERAMRGCQGVIHLAAVVGSPDMHANHVINAEGTRHVIEACHANHIRRLIFTSSVSAIRQYKGPYGRSKVEAEKLLNKADMDVTIIRPTMVYGKESQGLNRIVQNVLRFPRIIPMIGTGKYVRQPVYVWDVANVLVQCLRNPRTIGQVYNLGGDVSITFRNLVLLIADILGVKKRIVPVPIPVCHLLGSVFQQFEKPLFTVEHIKGLSEDTVMDIAPLIRDLHFRPQPLRASLLLTLDAIINNRSERTIPDIYLHSEPHIDFETYYASHV